MTPARWIGPAMLAALSAVATPAAAQSRVYTNADLGKPLEQQITVTPEQFEALRARQFRLPSSRPGPTTFVIESDPTDGPFGPLYQSPRQPLAPFNDLPFGIPLFPYFGYGGPYFPYGGYGRPFLTPNAGSGQPGRGPRSSQMPASSPPSRGVRRLPSGAPPPGAPSERPPQGWRR